MGFSTLSVSSSPKEAIDYIKDSMLAADMSNSFKRSDMEKFATVLWNLSKATFKIIIRS